MDCGQVMTGIEMSGAAIDGKSASAIGVIKAGKNPAQAVLSDFKKKLESLTAQGQPAAVVQSAGSTPVQDLSMAADAAVQVIPQGTAGILEGFGLLDYQTDISAVVTDGAAQAGLAQTTDAAAAQQAQKSGQFARMLSNEQTGGEAQSAQPQMPAGAEKYSGSLESTNSGETASTTVVSTEDMDAAMQLKTKLSQSQQVSGTSMQQAESSAAVPAQPEQLSPVMVQSQMHAAQADKQQGVPQQATAQVPVQADETQTKAAQTAAADSATVVLPDAQNEAVQPTTEKKADAAQAPPDSMPDTAVNQNMEVPAKVQPTQVVSSAEAAEPQQTASSEFVKENVIRIVDKASVSVNEGRYEFDVELKPDFLGKVNIKLTMENGEVRMHVRAEDAVAKGLFADQASTLQHALKEKGIIVSTVDVTTYRQDAATTGRESQGQHAGGGNGQRNNGQTARSTERYSGGDRFDLTAPTSEMLGGSSVEYLA